VAFFLSQYQLTHLDGNKGIFKFANAAHLNHYDIAID
jgi:hypothetical protein